ncbi:MAG: ankyrin repeat domain-containing protein [Gemmatimonadetes bacterium]|nr:ankyrin repeat domain-containing protein [Gemmatimonadota bacterium]MDE3256475.1 ankyrin repeat domain-containing protein [Gemmatimonadota bacterium]
MPRTINRLSALVLLLAVAGCGVSLMDLSKRGDVDGVQRAIDRGSNVNGRTVQGHSPLTLAAREGHLDVVQALIQAGADVNAAAWTLATVPRTRAYRHEGGGLTRERFVNADSSGPQSRFMAERTQIDVDWVLKDGKTALMLAAEQGHFDVVKTLVDNGANVQLTSGGSWKLDRKPDKERFDFPMQPRFPEPRDPVEIPRNPYGDSGTYVEPDEASGITPGVGYDAYPRRFYDSPDRKTALDLAHEKGHTDVVDFLRTASTVRGSSSAR